MRRLALVASLAGLTACGGDPGGVPIGMADESAPVTRPEPWRSDALDTVYADTLGLFPEDSLAAAPDTLATPRVPDVAPAWAEVQRAVESGRRAEWMRATSGAPGADLAWAVLDTGPFRDSLLALPARELVRDGTARTARVVVGYDAAGRVVPQDEADRDRTLTLRLDVVDGAYRVVRVEAP